MTATCSGVGGGWPTARAMSVALTRPASIWSCGIGMERLERLMRLVGLTRLIP
jgi:hypothetical protein